MGKQTLPQTAFIILVALIAVTTSGCGPKITLAPELVDKPPAAIAVLPIAGLEDARPERVKYLQQSLQSELKNRGYTIIDDSILRRDCSDATCSNRSELANKYPQLGGFLSLNVSSFSRNNFGLGYYNTVAGTLTLTDTKGKQLAAVEARESERGGLVFESGQVVQGIINQARNFGDEKFNRLAEKFARTVTSKLPSPQLANAEAGPAAAIEQVDLKTLKPDVYQLCATGTPGAASTVIVRGLRTNLRETSPGKYCGIMRIDDASTVDGQLMVELRSAFGTAARRPVSLMSAALCDLSGRVKAARSKGTVTISILCSTLADSKPKKSEQLALECADSQQQCAVSKFIVYRAPSQQGPYEKVSELRNTSWTDRIKPGQSGVVYSVVSVDTNGMLSRPISITPTN